MSDNPALLRVNPEYLAWLLSLPTLERERLLGGNWKIRPAAGVYFKREWCSVVDQVPADLDIVRYWDLAATEKTEFNDPDWTVGFKLGRDRPVIPGLPKLPSRAALRFDDQQISRLAMFRSCPSSLVLSSPAPCLTLPTRVIGCLSLTSRDTMAEWRHPLSLR